MRERYLERLDEGPQQDPDCVTLSQQLDEPRSSEKAEKADVDEVFLKFDNFTGKISKTILKHGKVVSHRKFDHKGIHYRTDHRDEVEHVPPIFEVAL